MKRAVKQVLRHLGYELARVSPNSRHPNSADSVVRLSETLKEYRSLKLHFGCGPRILKGWINIDLSYEPYQNYLQYYTDRYYPPELRGDSSDLYAIDVAKCRLPIPDGTVDVIFHEDFLEHLSQRDQILFLAETLRVLKTNAVHRINTPNLLSSMRDHSDFSKGFTGVYTDEWNKHGHLNVLTPAALKELALMVGYSEVSFNQRNKSATDLIPLEYRPDPSDRPEDGNIFADLIK